MKTKFIFLVLPEIHLMDLAGPDQVIHEAIDYEADFEIEYCCLENSVQSTAGLPIGNLKKYDTIQISKGDFIIIPGSNASYLISDSYKKEKKLHQWIVKNHQNGVNICSICAGSFALAETGLLDGVQCTTHFKRTKQLQNLYPKTKVVENILFTDNDGIYTSAGIASGIDLALHIVEKLKGSHFAHLVAREMVVYNRRNGNQKQHSEMLDFRNHIHSGIHKVQDYLIENQSIKHDLTSLSEIANMSERNFTRIFKKETNCTVNEFITIIRKEKIEELMKNPDLSRIEIANKVGLQSERQLGRIINGV